MNLSTAVLLAGVVAPASPAVTPIPDDGRALIREMHARYVDSWYKTLTFVQTTTFGDGRVQTWHEAIAVPGQLRIDIEPLDGGPTILFRNDTLYQYQGGTLAGAQPLVHPLLVLGFDVYLAPPEETIAKLEGLGFDLDVIREDTWQDRPVYVVGAAEGDLDAPQFWIDREHLYFVRMLQPAGPGGTVRSETQFNDYQPLGGGWIAPEVVFMNDGQMVLHEVYRDMRADVDLPADLFDPDPLQPPRWIEGR